MLRVVRCRLLWMVFRIFLEFQFFNQSQFLFLNVISCDNFQEVWDLLYRVLLVFIIVICFCGFGGNFFVLSVFFLFRRRLNVVEIYLANLAVFDLVFVLGLFFWVENIWNQFYWFFGVFFCRVVNGVIKVNLFISIFLVVVISQDRYCVLVYFMVSRRRRRRRQVQVICVFIWVMGGFLSVFTFLFRFIKIVSELNIFVCVLGFFYEVWNFARIVELNVLVFFLSLVVIVFFNYYILVFLRVQIEVSRTRYRGFTDGKITVFIFVFVVIFLVCWIFYYFFVFLEFLFQVRVVRGCFWENFIDLGLQCVNFFVFINSCLNLVIYVFVGQFFRIKVWEFYK